jgi:hypothetical protein
MMCLKKLNFFILVQIKLNQISKSSLSSRKPIDRQSRRGPVIWSTKLLVR